MNDCPRQNPAYRPTPSLKSFASLLPPSAEGGCTQRRLFGTESFASLGNCSCVALPPASLQSCSALRVKAASLHWVNRLFSRVPLPHRSWSCDSRHKASAPAYAPYLHPCRQLLLRCSTSCIGLQGWRKCKGAVGNSPCPAVVLPPGKSSLP